jgi:hypothetical protein
MQSALEVSSNKNQTDEFLKSWGSLYPRSGFLNQKNEVKTASVIAACDTCFFKF